MVLGGVAVQAVLVGEQDLVSAFFALFVALLPATATVVGVAVLQQLPSLVDLEGIAFVMAGIALHQVSAADS